MATTLLSSGQTHALTQNTVYALPGRLVFVTASAALEYSLDGSTWVALTGANTTGVNTSAPFVRCPGGAANIQVR